MPQSKIHVGLEIGTTKTCMVVGEIHPDATATILGIGSVRSVGVKKGEIHDLSLARQCVWDAWRLAQDHAEVDILNIFLSVTGDHFVGQNSTGSYRLPEGEDIITPEHMKMVAQKAKQIDLPPEHYTLESILGGYSIDGAEASAHPVGLTGRTLDTNCHTVHGIKTRIQNSLRCVRQVPLEVEDVIFAPLATAQMILTRQQREMGALLIDIGGGTTDYICYAGGEVVASGCLPVGGNTINDDIIKLSSQRINRTAAETLKCTEGNAYGDQKDRTRAEYRDELGMHEVSIERGALNRIICDRLMDTLMRIQLKIPADVWKRPGMGVYFSGGTSLMRGLDILARQIFKVPIYQPAPISSKEQGAFLQDPRYCTPIGLIRFAQRYDDDALHHQASAGFWSRMKQFFRRKS